MEARDLEEIIEDYENLRQAFFSYRSKKEVDKKALIEYEARFVALKADLRPHRKHIAGEWQKRDDKAATAIKFRLAIAIHNGTLKDDDDQLLYDPCSINQAEKFASGSKKYQEFLEQRTFYRESLVNLTDLRNDLDGYINLIKDILKAI